MAILVFHSISSDASNTVQCFEKVCHMHVVKIIVAYL